MKVSTSPKTGNQLPTSQRIIITLLVGVLLFPFNIFSATLAFHEMSDLRKADIAEKTVEDEPEVKPDDPTKPIPIDTTLLSKELPDSILLARQPLELPTDVVSEEFTTEGDSLRVIAADTIPVHNYDDWVLRPVEFQPNPTRAVWLSALFPGLGQIYNRRYWKLPIVVGGYMGLIYATSWNNTMLEDYTRAYADIMDNDPSTKSYMDFFPPNVKEENLDKAWLTSTLKNKKDYFRRNRDLCVICMVGVYLLAMVDAYVDASLSHFDISPDLTMDVTPAVFQDTRSRIPAVGINWAFNF